MVRRFGFLTAMALAAVTPAATWAQTYDSEMPAPYSVTGGYSYAPSDGVYTYGRTRYTQLPDDKGFSYGETNVEHFLRETFRHSYFRMEYLNWSYSDPGENLLGAPILRDVPVGAFLNNPNAFNNNTVGNVLNTRIPFRVPGLTINGVESNNPDSTDFENLDLGPYNGFGVNPTLEGVKNIHNNGLRGTWGFNFEPMTWESSIFALQSSRASVTPRYVPVTDENGQVIPGQRVLVDAIPQTDVLGQITDNPYINGTFVVQGLLRNGQLSDNAYLIYDRSFQASIRSSVWGADTKVLSEGVNNGGLFSIRPLLGVKFLNFNERLTQQGVASAGVSVVDPSFSSGNQGKVTDQGPATAPQPDVFRQINASALNYLYGPQLGARFELGNQYFAVGCEPKMMFGVNSYRSTLDYSLPTVVFVSTGEFDANNNEIFTYVQTPNTKSTRVAKTTFGPVADVEVYARGRMSDHLNVFVAYNMIWAGMITRPGNNIVYNINENNVYDFTQDVKFTDLLIQGVSVGGEVNW